jgi:Mg2+/Co2+ transporter CorB
MRLGSAAVCWNVCVSLLIIVRFVMVCDILSLCLSWCVQIILRPFFKKYDKNNDGHLSIQELAVVFK